MQNKFSEIVSQTNRQAANVILNKINENATLENINTQPIYNLPRDTISTFLYETKDILCLKEKVSVYFSFEMTVLSIILTGNNFQIGGIDITDPIMTILYLFLIIVGYKLIQNLYFMHTNRKLLSVKNLTEELGKRAIFSIK